jgi:hypothetical protein
LTLVYRRQTLGRGEMLEWLAALTAASGESSQTFYLPTNLSPTEVENSTKTLGESPDINSKLIDIAIRSKTGTAVFWSRYLKCLIMPPFIISNRLSIDQLSVNYLQKLFSYDYIIALMLIRLGSYAIGVYRGEKCLGSKVGTGLVHGRHRQGGSSAHRFERHRDKQIEYFMTRVCQHAREQIEPYLKSLDYISYGGARTTIIQLQKQCPLLGRLKTPTLPPLLDIPDPRQLVLEKAISRIWSSTVYTWHED